MTEKRARTPLSKVRIPFFEREYTPVKPTRMRARFKTVDDVVFEVSDASIVPSTYMNRLIYGSRVNKQPSDITHPLPNVAADVFEKVMRYCYFHTSKYCDSLLPNQVKEWDDQFMDLDPRQLCELASAAYYLDVKDLIELTCRAIAAIISGKSAEQIRKTFHIENDLAGTIDRVLPASARRRGREHTPRENIRHADSGDTVSLGQDQNDISQQNPGPQKTVDEIIEWIDSTSSKSQKKKKKKRRKDKNPSKKESDNLANDEEICELGTSHTTPTDVQAEIDGELDIEGHEPAPSANEIPRCNTSIENRETAKGSNPKESLPDSENNHDGESSNSDIAIVSERIVNPRASTSRKGSTLSTEAPKNSTISEKGDYHGQQAARLSTSRDADAVECTQQITSSEPQAVKQENSSRNGTTSSGECADSTEIIAPHRKRASHCGIDIEDEDIKLSPRGVPSRMRASERRGDQAFHTTEGDDVTMTEVPEIRALRSEQVSEEPFIDCPENMDREVEDFQQRLTITEPLSTHRHVPQTQSSGPVPERRRTDTLPPIIADANGSWDANGTIPKVSVSPQSTRELDNSQRGDVLPSTDFRQSLQGTEHSTRHDAQIKGPSIPKQVLAELLRINSEKEECAKIAAAIDEETARLGAKREKVRDTLAFLNMQERQVRAKYKLSDHFP